MRRKSQQPWTQRFRGRRILGYCVHPTGLTRGSGARGVGLMRLTGGEIFSNSNDFPRAAHAIFSEIADYYLLGYGRVSRNTMCDRF